mmetsp:Transcript_2848/g.4518  ORF Transcript_2848/g.4518 Transcript_2848/m.4518 type:complete len:81 (-) Transcript_2848:14-256(-)
MLRFDPTPTSDTPCKRAPCDVESPGSDVDICKPRLYTMPWLPRCLMPPLCAVHAPRPGTSLMPPVCALDGRPVKRAGQTC